MILKKTKRTQTAQWISGLAAASAATSTQGALVQVNLTGNTSVTAGGDTINTDWTDGVLLMVALRSAFSSGPSVVGGFLSYVEPVRERAAATSVTLRSIFGAFAPSSFGAASQFGRGGSARGAFEVSFSAGGGSVPALLFVTAGGVGSTRGITLDSIVWDDGSGVVVDLSSFSTEEIDNMNPRVLGEAETGERFLELAAVPEPSSLALLALGAAGVVTRRQRKKAA